MYFLIEKSGLTLRTSAAVKGRNNRTTELRLRCGLVRAGLRGWHVNVKGLRGSPDFYFPREKLVVFTDGCFWHGCQRCGHTPAKNNTFWSTKIERNRERDAKVTHYWLTEGFTVLRLWGHELTEDLKDCIRRIRKEMA